MTQRPREVGAVADADAALGMQGTFSVLIQSWLQLATLLICTVVRPLAQAMLPPAFLSRSGCSSGCRSRPAPPANRSIHHSSTTSATTATQPSLPQASGPHGPLRAAVSAAAKLGLT